MGDWIGLGIIVLVLACVLYGLSRLGRPPEQITSEEFERRVEEARGTMRSGAFAGFYALQKLMNPRAAEAVEVQRDLRAGFYDETEESGEGGRDEEENEVGDQDGGDGSVEDDNDDDEHGDDGGRAAGSPGAGRVRG